MSEAVAAELAADIAEVDPKPKSKYDRSIIEGPLGRAVWKIAWPTMLTNIIAGMQGIVDHILVGNLVGFTGNAAIGVSTQLWIVVIVFISSLFTGMSVLVARFAGAHDEAKVNRTVYQAFLTALIIAVGIMAPIGYFAAPYLLDFVSSDAGVKAEALPFLRISFVFSFGLLIFFMTSGALRSAGDAKTPMVLGIVMTVLNLILNIIFISGLGPIPAFGTTGAAIGTSIATGTVGIYAIYKMWSGGWVVGFPRGQGWAPHFIDGVNANGRRRTGRICRFIYTAFLINNLDVGRFDGSGGGRCGAKPWRRQPRQSQCGGSHGGQIWNDRRRVHRACVLFLSGTTARHFRHERTRRCRDRHSIAENFEYFRHIHFRRANLYWRPTRHRRHKKPTLHLDHFTGLDTARNLLCYKTDGNARADTYLAGDPGRTFHAMRT